MTWSPETMCMCVWVTEADHWIKYLLYEHDYLSLHPQCPFKRLSIAMCTWDPRRFNTLTQTYTQVKQQCTEKNNKLLKKNTKKV